MPGLRCSRRRRRRTRTPSAVSALRRPQACARVAVQRQIVIHVWRSMCRDLYIGGRQRRVCGHKQQVCVLLV
jgi:hypothetical protein